MYPSCPVPSTKRFFGRKRLTSFGDGIDYPAVTRPGGNSMAVAKEDYVAWLAQADIPAQRRTPQLDVLLEAVFRFRQQQGNDYYSTRLLSHFLLHCECGLKVAQIARLVGVARPTASKQQGMSSKAAIGQAHHRMDGRSHGKLLPRYAGPIAAFFLSHPKASQAELLEFVAQTF